MNNASMQQYQMPTLPGEKRDRLCSYDGDDPVQHAWHAETDILWGMQVFLLQAQDWAAVPWQAQEIRTQNTPPDHYGRTGYFKKNTKKTEEKI